MPTNSAVDYLLRRKILEKIYGSMSEDEKRFFTILTMQNRSTQEIMQALKQQNAQISSMAEKIGKQSWFTDFGSDVAANFFTDGLIWLARKLFRR